MESLDVTLSINNKLKDGTTPIYLACKVGNLKNVKYLIINGAKSSITPFLIQNAPSRREGSYE